MAQREQSDDGQEGGSTKSLSESDQAKVAAVLKKAADAEILLLLIKAYEISQDALKESVIRGLDKSHDINANADIVPRSVYADFDRRINEAIDQLKQWANLDDDKKEQLSARIEELGDYQHEQALRRAKNQRDIAAVKALLEELQRADAVARLQGLREQAQELQRYSHAERLYILRFCKKFRKRRKNLLGDGQRRQLAEVIALMRNAVGRKWWQLWL